MGWGLGSELSSLLRAARLGAGCSQLELSLRLGVSQRHVNFIERGRARPSRQLLLAWLREAGSAASLYNAALLQAGYAPLAPGAGRTGHNGGVLLQTITLHQPNPGLVFNADWYVVQANPAGRWLCEVVMPGVWQGDRLDMLATLADPRGWLARARQPARIAAALLGQLRAEQWLRPSLRPRIDALEHALKARYGSLQLPGDRDPSATSFEVTLDTPLGALAFCAVQALVGLPHDAAGARLRAELWFAADAHTSCVLNQHAQEMAKAA
jgi:transcriptional regulator with XRE-family HTH domain